MRVLVTGATGYLGSQLCRALLSRSHSVVALKRSGSSLARLALLEQDIVFHDVDSMDASEWLDQPAPVEAILHVATCYGRKGESVAEVIDANVRFPSYLLEAAATRAIPFLNTDTVLPPHLSAYALSKSQFRECGRLLADNQSARFVNVKLDHFYGPGDDPSKFTTYLFMNCLNNAKFVELTLGEQKRDFVYIDDVISAYLFLLERAMRGAVGYEEFGVGSGHAVTVRQFAELVKQTAGATTKLRFGAVPYRKGEPMECANDTTRIRSMGWAPKLSLKEGVENSLQGDRTQ